MSPPSLGGSRIGRSTGGPMRGPTAGRWLSLAVVIVMSLALTGCQGTWRAMFPEQELKSRPTFEEASVTYIGILEEMRAEISRLAPTVRWRRSPATQTDESGCSRPFNGVPRATSGTFDTGGAVGGIPEDQWAAARDGLTAIAAQHGFTGVVVLRDVPGEHTVSFLDLLGAEIMVVTTSRHASLGLLGSCFLSTTTRNWSTPSPSPAGDGSPTPRR